MSRSTKGMVEKTTIVVIAGLLCINNLLPYVGMRDDSCQTMFSGLRWGEGWNNHYLAPQLMSSDLWLYYTDVSADLDPPAPEFGRVHDLERWLDQEERELNTEAVRVVVRQICDRGHRVTLRYRTRGLAREADAACDDPQLSAPHAWIPIRLFDSHIPLRREGEAEP